MQYIASVQGYVSSGSYCDASSTLNVQAGDILVTMIFGDIQTGLTLTVADTLGNNTHTSLGWTNQWLRQGIAYRISATANASATIRATISAASWGHIGIVVMQFRPSAGVNVSFGNGPASNGSSWGTNPTSTQLSSSGAALWIGAATSGASMSSPEIGNVAVDGSVSRTSSYYAMMGYRVISSAQSNIAFDTTAGDNTWGAQLLCLSITESGGSNEISGSHTLTNLSQSGTLDITQTITGSHTLTNLSQSGTLDITQTITGSHTLTNLSQAGNIYTTEFFEISGTHTFSPLQQAGAIDLQYDVTGTNAFTGLQQSGTIDVTGNYQVTGAHTLGPLQNTGTIDLEYTITGTHAFSDLQQSGTLSISFNTAEISGGHTLENLAMSGTVFNAIFYTYLNIGVYTIEKYLSMGEIDLDTYIDAGEYTAEKYIDMGEYTL